MLAVRWAGESPPWDKRTELWSRPGMNEIYSGLDVKSNTQSYFTGVDLNHLISAVPNSHWSGRWIKPVTLISHVSNISAQIVWALCGWVWERIEVVVTAADIQYIYIYMHF